MKRTTKIIFILLQLISLKSFSQLLTGVSDSYFHSIQIKSENYSIPEYGILKLSKDQLCWQLKMGYGSYDIEEDTYLFLFNSYSYPNSITTNEKGYGLFLKPGYVFHISRKQYSKRKATLGAFNLHTGISFNRLNLRYNDAVYGNINKHYHQTKLNCAVEFELIHIIELYNRIGMRLGLHTGVKAYNPTPFIDVLPVEPAFRKHYTPGLGIGSHLYYGFSAGFILR